MAGIADTLTLSWESSTNHNPRLSGIPGVGRIMLEGYCHKYFANIVLANLPQVKTEWLVIYVDLR